jgi:hypothetical protein
MGTAQTPYTYDEKTVNATDETGQEVMVGEHADYQISPEEERRLLWKLDLL